MEKIYAFDVEYECIVELMAITVNWCMVRRIEHNGLMPYCRRKKDLDFAKPYEACKSPAEMFSGEGWDDCG